MRKRWLRDLLVGAGRALRTSWLMLGVTLILLAVVELSLRGVLALKDRLRPLPLVDPRVVALGYDGAPWVDGLYREQESVRTEWRPYVVHRALPFDGESLSIDADGLRRTPMPKAAGVGQTGRPLRIEVAGGSVAWGMGARDVGTIAARIGIELNEVGRDVLVINRAQIGYVSTQEVIDLMLDLRERKGGERPDVVVFVDGVNEVLSAYQNGRAGWPQNEANRVAEFNIRESAPRLFGGWLGRMVRDSALGRVAGSIAARLGARAGRVTAGRVEWSKELADEVISNYQANVNRVDALAREYGFRALFVWQPVLFTKEDKTEYEREKAREYGWLEQPLGDVAGRVGTLEAPSERVRFIDLSRALDTAPELLYVDFCHVTETGHARLGAAIARELDRWMAEEESGDRGALESTRREAAIE